MDNLGLGMMILGAAAAVKAANGIAFKRPNDWPIVFCNVIAKIGATRVQYNQ